METESNLIAKIESYLWFDLPMLALSLISADTQVDCSEKCPNVQFNFESLSPGVKALCWQALGAFVDKLGKLLLEYAMVGKQHRCVILRIPSRLLKCALKAHSYPKADHNNILPYNLQARSELLPKDFLRGNQPTLLDGSDPTVSSFLKKNLISLNLNQVSGLFGVGRQGPKFSEVIFKFI